MATHHLERVADCFDVGIGAFKQLLHQIGFAIGGRQQCGFNATAAVLRQVAGGVHHVGQFVLGQLSDEGADEIAVAGRSNITRRELVQHVGGHQLGVLRGAFAGRHAQTLPLRLGRHVAGIGLLGIDADQHRVRRVADRGR